MTRPRIPRPSYAVCWLCLVVGVVLWCCIGGLGWWLFA
jgi:hypothetical protein